MAVDQISYIVADLERVTARGMVALILDVNANLVEATPVDLGWARAGWVPSIGQPYDGGDNPRPTDAMVGPARARQVMGQNEVLGYRMSDGPLFSTNNVTYILPLAEGWSPQAAAGWVETAIENAVDAANRRALPE